MLGREHNKKAWTLTIQAFYMLLFIPLEGQSESDGSMRKRQCSGQASIVTQAWGNDVASDMLIETRMLNIAVQKLLKLLGDQWK